MHANISLESQRQTIFPFIPFHLTHCRATLGIAVSRARLKDLKYVTTLVVSLPACHAQMISVMVSPPHAEILFGTLHKGNAADGQTLE